MNYQETLSYLYAQLPALHKKGWDAYKPGLERVSAMLEKLGNPHKQLRFIHVAGTNGKGSVSHFLASILQESGLKVGLFTSPHLKDFRERIKVNGEQVSEKEVVDFVANFSILSHELKPSFFEYTFSLGMRYFAACEVDLVVLETGLGGRLDCTNVVEPILSVITNVSMDHEQFLGDSLSAIAREKAGIIKRDTPVVIGRFQAETAPVFAEIADVNSSPLFLSDPTSILYPAGLKGRYQEENQRTALKCVDVLNTRGVAVSSEDCKRGLLNVIKNTGMMGRWQLLTEDPKTICDVGHNPDGVREIVKQLRAEKAPGVRVIWGMVADKKTEEIFKLLPTDYIYYWCAANNPRALSAEKLKEQAKAHQLKGQVFNSVQKAFHQAEKDRGEGELLFVGGSTFVVAELL